MALDGTSPESENGTGLITRRSFLKGAAILVGGAVASSVGIKFLSPSPPDKSSNKGIEEIGDPEKTREVEERFEIKLIPNPKTTNEIMSMTMKLSDSSIAFLLSILATSDKSLEEKMVEYKEKLADGVEEKAKKLG